MSVFTKYNSISKRKECTTPDEAVDHSVDTGLGYRTGTVQIGSIHHNAVTKQVYVKDADGYEYCDGCNEILHK